MTRKPRRVAAKENLSENTGSFASPPPNALAPGAHTVAAEDGGGGAGPAAPVAPPRLVGVQAAKACEAPSIGRIVVVVGRPLTEPAPEGSHGQHMTAIITRVHNLHVVDLTVFPPGSASLAATKVPHGTAPGEWLWPREVPGE